MPTDLYRQALLHHHPRPPLPPLMELDESPPAPAVPPKDAGYKKLSMDSGSVSQPASGSKRKREPHDDTIYSVRDGRLEVADLDSTPTKRLRSNAGTSDGYTSNDETPIQRSVRRKKGMSNLSRVNLRHAASMSKLPPRQSSPTRESKFQEGSLSDKPSDEPPSVYTRIIRSDSSNLEHVDQLMTDYHEGNEGNEGMPTPTDSIKAALEYEKATMPQRVAEINARQKKEEGGVYRFGKSIAAAFHPVSLWNRLWSEQREELVHQGPGTDDAHRKRAAKEDVDARYAEMKSTGQFQLQPVSLHKAHDSAIALDAPLSNQDRGRHTSFGSMLRPSLEDFDSRAGSEVPESASKPPLRGIRSRLHLRRPSLQNLKNGITGGLKRVASDMNLAGSVDRESSSSVSPTKPEFGSALKHSQSRQDMKRQRRLSKRVGNLEAKLEKARSELGDALVAASPVPVLGSRYERFTPTSTVRRPKFVPGALATLPSEGVLFPERAGTSTGDQSTVNHVFPRQRKVLDLSKAFDDIDDEDEDDEETVKAPRGRPYPANVKELFDDTQQMDDQHSQAGPGATSESKSPNEPTSELTEFTEVSRITSDALPEVEDKAENGDEPSSRPEPSTDEPATSTEDGAKTIKASRKSGKSKKRRNIKDDDKVFRPGKEDDEDESELEEAAAQPKKKRKSTGKTGACQTTTTKRKSPAGKTGQKAVNTKTSPKQVKEQMPSSADAIENEGDDEAQGEDELTKVASARGSMISNPESLEPVYEEEEEMTTTTTVTVKDVPSKPTAKATPARFGWTAGRSQPSSPQKQEEMVEVVVEEKIMTRAAQAAQHRRGSRSSSPPPLKTDAIKTVVPGIDNIPALPKAASGTNVESTPKKKRVATKEKFEWPDDVF